MYLKYYKLDKDPFSVSPDPEFLFLSSSHREAAASVYYGVAQRKGFVIIVGEVGTGKTTILRYFMEGIDRSKEDTIYIFNSNLSFTELLRTILDGSDEDDPNVLLQQLYKRLIKTYREGRNVALIIDEAQNMPIETLENLRMLSNLETNKNKLIQIVLAGQPELDEKLNAYELRQLKQRIVIRAVITPLTRNESYEYIQHRLTTAAAKNTQIFKQGALRQIVKHAHGIPRDLNILCDNTLLAGFAHHDRPVSAATAREVVRHRLQKTRPRFAWGWATAVGLVVIVGVVAATLQRDQGLLAPHLIDQVSGLQTDLAAPTPAAVESQTSEATEEPDSTSVTGGTVMEPEPDLVVAGRAALEAPSETLTLDSDRASASLAAKVDKSGEPDAVVQGAASPEKETMSEPVGATERSLESGVSETDDEVVLASTAERTEEPIGEGNLLTTGKPDVSSEVRLDDRSAELAVVEMEMEPASVETGTTLVETQTPSVETGVVSMDTESESVEIRLASAVEPLSSSAVSPVARYVKDGDTLGDLCIEVYGPGYANHQVYARVKEANPSIIDENRIRPGQRIFFPELPETL